MNPRKRIFAATGACLLVAGAVAFFVNAGTSNVGSSAIDTDAMDPEVLEAVLIDLLEYRTTDSPLSRGSDHVLFATDPAEYPQTVDEVLYEHEPWNLPSSQRRELQAAAGHLVSRIKQRDAYERTRFHDPRIHIYDRGIMEKDPKRLDYRPIEAWPPGYSNDGRLAVVRLVIPWSMHHAEGTFLLTESGGKWTVILRQFVYYP